MWSRLAARAAPAAVLAVPSTCAWCDGPPRNFVTYNVLSSHLAGADHFRTVPPADLAAPTRLERVEGKLRAPAKARAVITLQEVSTDWAGKLHCFFAQHGYQSFFSNYGGKHSGRMGVCLAYPDDLEATEVEIVHIGDSISAPPPVPGSSPPGSLSRYGLLSYHGMKDLLGADPDKVEGLKSRYQREWGHAKQRSNCAVMASLRPKGGGQEFVVAVYHAPCLFASVEDRSVQNLHILALKKEVERFARGKPVVVLGDFNLKPDESGYNLLTGGKLGHEEAPETFDRVYSAMPLVSAYRQYHGGEPVFTNCAQTRHMKTPFRETLDYIFTSPGVKVVACPALPAFGGPMPTKAEPSDHLLLEATLQFP